MEKSDGARNRLRAIWAAIPLKTALALVVVCFAVKENFPFSHFPMYSSFSDYSYYIYFKDANDEPVPILDLSGHRTAALKKIYNYELQKTRKALEKQGVKIEGYRFMTAEQRKPAAEYTLQWIYDNPKGGRTAALNAKRPLRLYHVHLWGRDGKTVPEEELIAEVP